MKDLRERSKGPPVVARGPSPAYQRSRQSRVAGRRSRLSQEIETEEQPMLAEKLVDTCGVGATGIWNAGLAEPLRQETD